MYEINNRSINAQCQENFVSNDNNYPHYPKKFPINKVPRKLKLVPGVPLLHKRRPERHMRINQREFYERELMPKEKDLTLVAETIKKLPKAAHKLLDFLVYMEKEEMGINMSQTRLGMHADVGRSVANIHLQKLASLGLIDIYGQGMLRACLYRVSPIFKKPELWNLLQDTLPIFKQLALGFTLFGLLLSPKTIVSNMMHRSGTRTTSNINIYKYKGEKRRQGGYVNKNYNPRGNSPPISDEELLKSKKLQLIRLRQTNNFYAQMVEHSKKVEQERGTERALQNEAQAEENLRKIFGDNWRSTVSCQCSFRCGKC